MNWHLSVRNEGGNLEEVAELHSKHVESVLALLKEMEIPAEEQQTARMEFGENWVCKNKSRIQEGYFASTEIFFKIKDLKKYKSLWVTLSKIDHVTVEGVYYDHSNRIEYQDETRKKALLAARSKAIALSEALGSEIGEPLLIEEDTSIQDYARRSLCSNSISFVNESDFDAIESIAPGKIPIRIRMKLSFRLITHKK